MPRKQRFKPSRKPKTEAPRSEPQSIPSDAGGPEGRTEPHRDEPGGVIDAAGETT